MGPGGRPDFPEATYDGRMRSEIVAGRVGVNNPIGVATIEPGNSELRRPAEDPQLGTSTTSWSAPVERASFLCLVVARLFMCRAIHRRRWHGEDRTGDGNDHRAIWRVDRPLPAGRLHMTAPFAIAEMKNGLHRGSRATARTAPHFFDVRRTFFPFTHSDREDICQKTSSSTPKDGQDGAARPDNDIEYL